MKNITINKQSREVLIDGNLAGVGWTEQMEKDVAKFGNKISLTVTKCMFIKLNEKYDLNPWEIFRFRNLLQNIF